MTEAQIECAIWLMLEYESHRGTLNTRGLELLLKMRDDWNLEQAKVTMLVSEGEQMTYKEAYMNCKSKEEFRTMVEKDTSFAILFNIDRLKSIEDAVNMVCQVHPEWSDEVDQMTNEEAIKNLERPSTIHGDAIRMAVEALEKMSAIKDGLDSLKEDLQEAYKLNDAILSYVLKYNPITELESRAEVFSLRMMQDLSWLVGIIEGVEQMTDREVIEELEWIYQNGFENDLSILGTDRILDSIRIAIEEVEKQSEIVHCRDCKYWTRGTLEGLNRTLQVPACKLAGWLCAEDGFCMHGERNVEQMLMYFDFLDIIIFMVLAGAFLIGWAGGNYGR